jgi:hypothetical protein
MARPRAATIATIGAAAVGFGAFAGFRIWQARVGDPLIWQDSLQYEALGNRSLFSHWIWSGDRPPVTPLLWKVAGNAPTFVVLQTLFAVVAWGVLAVVVARLVRPWWGRLLAGGLVLGFACTRPVVQWDRSVLSESMSLSSLALLFAMVILWANHQTVLRGVAVVAVALLFAATRDTQLWVVAVLAIAFGAYAMWRGVRAEARAARPALLVTTGLVLVVALTAASSMSSHRDVQNVEHALAVRVFPYPERIQWFADHGMPQAKRLTALALGATRSGDQAPVVGIDPADPHFQRLVRWMKEDGARTYVLWLVLHPDVVVREPFERPERTFNNADGHLSFYAAVDRTDATFLTAVLYPPWEVVLVVGALALVGGELLGQTRRLAWIAVVVLGALGLFHMLVAWHGDGMEVTRHASVGNVQVRLAVLVLVAFLLDGRRPRPRRPRVPQPEVSMSPRSPS